MMKKETEVEVRYRLMVGDLFVKTVNRKGIELTTRVGEAFSAVDNFEYSGKDNDYYSHERLLSDKITEIAEHGIDDVRIVEYKVVTQRTEIEFELVRGLNSMSLQPIEEPTDKVGGIWYA